MLTMFSPVQLGLCALVAQIANAHFVLTHPVALGSKMSAQGTSPCGGFEPSFERTTEYYVGGEAVSVVTSHPHVNLLIRGTLDPTGSGNWTNLFPVVAQFGIGDFCEPLVPAPAEWVGRNGIIQVIQSGQDGLLYQCAAVSFHGERAASITTLCSNGTDVTGSFSSDPKLPSDGAGFAISGSGTTTQAGTDGNGTTSAPVAATTTPSVGSSLASYTAMVGAMGACLLSAALLS